MRKTVSAVLGVGVVLALAQGSAVGQARGPIVTVPGQISPTAPPVPPTGDMEVAGNFAGDARDEVFFYTPGSVPESLIRFDNGGAIDGDLTWQVHSHSVHGLFNPLVGDFDADGHDDIFWQGYGSDPDYLWEFTSFTSRTSTPYTVSGNYYAFTGDFTGDGADDIFWYGPGGARDFVWEFDPGGQYNNLTMSVGGYYQPIVGSFGTDATDDIMWYGAGGEPDHFWDLVLGGDDIGLDWTTRPMPVNGYYTPVVTDLWQDGSRGEDILWGSYEDNPIWDFQGGVLRRTRDAAASTPFGLPLGGDFVGDGHGDVLWVRWEAFSLWDHAPDPDFEDDLLRLTYDTLGA